jgi:hypothetical protein
LVSLHGGRFVPGAGVRAQGYFSIHHLPKIEGIDFGSMNHLEIASLLPPYGGKHPMKAILVDQSSARGYGVASGWDAEDIVYHGVPYRAGALTPETAAQAGPSWRRPGNHLEAVASAFMRQAGIAQARISTVEVPAGAMPRLPAATTC